MARCTCGVSSHLEVSIYQLHAGSRVADDLKVPPIWGTPYFFMARLLQTMRGGPMCEQSLRPCLWDYWGMVGKTMVSTMVFTSVFTMVFTLFDHEFRWFYHLCSDSRAIDQVLGFPSLLVHYWVFTPCHVEPHRVDTLILQCGKPPLVG